MPQISESTERRILDSLSQDEQDTHETQSEATFDSDDTQSDTRLSYPAFIWGSGQVITSSLYSSTIAWHNSGMKVEIVSLATRKPNYSVVYLSPAARRRKVIASFKHCSKDFLVLFFWIRGSTLFNISFLVASEGNWKANARLPFIALP